MQVARGMVGAQDALPFALQDHPFTQRVHDESLRTLGSQTDEQLRGVLGEVLVDCGGSGRLGIGVQAFGDVARDRDDAVTNHRDAHLECSSDVAVLEPRDLDQVGPSGRSDPLGVAPVDVGSRFEADLLVTPTSFQSGN